MKLFIGPYRTYWSVPKIVNLLQKVGVGYETRDKIENWISEHTPADKIFEWLNDSLPSRKIKIRIDEYDTWNMDHTLSLIILPMLKQLQGKKYGSPLVDNEDVPTQLRHGDPDGYDNWVHYKWEFVLNEMIWAFEQNIDDDWQDQYVHGTPTYKWVEREDDTDEFVITNPKDYWIDNEGMDKHRERMNNGFRLFGKYFQSLWS